MMSWRTIELREAASIMNGGTPKTGVEAYWDGGVPWLTPAEMGKRVSPYINETRRTLSEAGLNNSSAKLIPPQSIILSTRAPIGHLAINEVPMAFNQGCRGIVPTSDFDTKYVFYFLQGNRELLDSLGVGTTFKELSATNLGRIKLPAPSLAEQRRIVAILDEAFEGIATATANAEKNLANARELFESELDAEILKAQRQYSSVHLEKACRRITVGHVGPMKTRYVTEGVPFLRSQNVRPFEISREGMMYIDHGFDSELSKSRLRPGDVAVVRTGYPGTAAVIPNDIPEANCADLVIVRPASILNPHFVVAFLNSRVGKRAVAGELVGAAQKHFNIGAARRVLIPVPPEFDQQAIVERLQTASSYSIQLVHLHQRKLALLAELKQSILHRAFNGDLSPAEALAA
jgi:type I restriction enzyme S subunit